MTRHLKPFIDTYRHFMLNEKGILLSEQTKSLHFGMSAKCYQVGINNRKATPHRCTHTFRGKNFQGIFLVCSITLSEFLMLKKVIKNQCFGKIYHKIKHFSMTFKGD